MAAVLRSGHPSKGPDVRAPRSKGCLTCRRRKVKCDERRPTCQRCQKGLHTCLGYEQPLIFVHQVPGLPSTTSTTATTTLVSVSASKAAPIHAAVDGSTAQWEAGHVTNPSCADLGLSSASLDLGGFQDEIVIAHFLSKFSGGFGNHMPRGTDAPTMAAVLTSSSSTSSAYLSGLGLAQAFFGRIHRDYDMVRQSARLYGKALTSLRGDLQLVHRVDARSRAYMNLWTSLFLGLYEMVLSAEPSNWLQHIMGISALTQLIGPEAFQSEHANAMLSMYRAMIAAGHISQRRRCFLANPAWKTVPWAGVDSPPKTLAALVCDVLCDIPGLMEHVDAMLESEASGHDVSADRARLQNKVCRSIGELARLRWQWEALYPNACAESSTALHEQGRPLFATGLEFESLDGAIDVLNFNAVRLMLYTLSDRVGLSEASLLSRSGQCIRNGPGSNPLVLPGQGDRITHALEICRTAKYMTQGSRDSQGLLILMFPLRVAYAHLQGLPEATAWIRQVLGSSGSKGFKLGEYVLKLQSQSVARARKGQ